MRVLITCVGGELMPQFLFSLKNNKEIKVTLVGIDSNSEARGKYFCDKFYQVPKGRSNEYIRKLQKIVIEEKISLIIPASDEEALKVSKHYDFFKSNKTKIACTDFETLKILNNKEKTYSFLEKKGYQLAKWSTANTGYGFFNQVKNFYDLNGSLVIKPISGRGSAGIFIIHKPTATLNEISDKIINFNGIKDFLKRYKNFTFPKKVIIMEKLFGPVCDIDLLSWKGTPISVICRKRIHENWPNKGHVIMKNKELRNLGKKIIKDFNLSWLYDCDVMFDNNGNPIPIEINPRQSGSIAISIKAGSNILNNLLRIYAGKQPLKENTSLSKYILPFTGLKNVNKIY